MPLTKIEQDICNLVAHRLLDQSEVTRRQTLLKEFKGSLADPFENWWIAPSCVPWSRPMATKPIFQGQLRFTIAAISLR